MLSLLGGFPYETYSKCANQAEWKDVLKDEPLLARVIDKWTIWLELVTFKNHIPTLPFNEKELNYVHSKFVDELLTVEGFKYEEAFIQACANGHLYLAKWIDSRIKYLTTTGKITHSLYVACRCNRLNIAEWVYSYMNDTAKRHFSDTYPGLLNTVCGLGWLHVAKWMHEKFPNIVIERRWYGGCLTNVLSNHHFDVAEWMLMFNHDTIDLRNCFIMACNEENFEAVRWLVPRYYQPSNEDCLDRMERTSLEIKAYLIQLVN